MKPTKPRRMFAARNPWGDILSGTVNYYASCSRRDVASLFVECPDNLYGPDRRAWFKAQWKQRYKEGYRIIPVMVTECARAR